MRMNKSDILIELWSVESINDLLAMRVEYELKINNNKVDTIYYYKINN